MDFEGIESAADEVETHAHPVGEEHQECVYCRHKTAFEMPPGLVAAVRRGDLVVFAGAGISTESGIAFPTSFLEEIAAELPPDFPMEDLPTVMTEYEVQFGRQKLVEQIIRRLRFAETFPSVRSVASNFHQELATISPIKDIVTTNWDCFFEDECGAIPIVVDSDYAFYGLPGRKVYKLHGSLRNVGTLVATSDDYREREETLRQSAVGGTLRHMLATKVVVYIGYSLRDADFRNIYEPLMASMGKVRPLSYFVSPFDSPEATDLGLRQIRTDGTYFLSVLKRALVDDGSLLDDRALERADRLAPRVERAHEETMEMDWRNNPVLVYSLAYQNGLLDALHRIQSQWITGEYTDQHRVSRSMRTYRHYLHVAIERERFFDAAYVDGYMNGLLLLLFDRADLEPDEDPIDFINLYEYFDDEFFHVLSEEALASDQTNDTDTTKDADEQESDDESPYATQEDLLVALDGFFEAWPAAREEALQIIKPLGDNLVPEHTPFLSGVMDPPDSSRPTS